MFFNFYESFIEKNCNIFLSKESFLFFDYTLACWILVP